MTQWGLPMVAAQNVNSRPSTAIVSLITSRGTPTTGILSEEKLTEPIAMVISLPPSLIATCTWPPGVSTVKFGFWTSFWSQR